MHWRVLLILPFAAALGCSGKCPVAGKVQFSDGTPLAGGMVIFEDERGASSGYGNVGPDGSFEITYDSPQDGLPKGNYRVAVRPPSPSAMTEAQRRATPPRSGIALKYLQPTTSEITVKIDRKRTDLVIQLEAEKGARK
jgi:hypothetical protein